MTSHVPPVPSSARRVATDRLRELRLLIEHAERVDEVNQDDPAAWARGLIKAFFKIEAIGSKTSRDLCGRATISELLSITEAADVAGVSRNTIYKWADDARK